MMTKSNFLLLALALLALACDDATSTGPDTQADATDTAVDSADTASDAGSPPDTSQDTIAPDTAFNDTTQSDSHIASDTSDTHLPSDIDDTQEADTGPIDAGPPTCVDATGVTRFVWEGGEDADFGNCFNWSPAAVPTAGQIVVSAAATNNLALPDTASFESLDVEQGFSLQVLVEGTLTLSRHLDIGGGTFDAGASTLTTGSVTISNDAVFLATTDAHVITGDFRVASTATFDARQGTVVIAPDGNTPSVIDAGGVAFWILETSTPGSTYHFQSGAELTIDWRWRAEGTDAEPITLAMLGGVSGADQWRVSPRRMRAIDHVSVHDSANTSGRRITPENWTDAGNNSQWGIGALVSSTPTSFAPNPSNFVWGIDITDGVITVGGEFGSFMGFLRQRIAAFTLDGTVQPFSASPLGTVRTVARDDMHVYAGGTFGGGFAVYDHQGNERLPNLTRSTDWSVHTVAVHQGVIYLSGAFTTLGGQPRHRLAAVLPDGTVTAFDPGLDDGGVVNRFVFDGDTIYMAGSFREVAGQPRSGLAALKTDGTLLPWAPQLGGTNRHARDMVKVGDVLYVCGTFTEVNGQAQSKLAAIDVDGNVLEWGPSVFTAVTALLHHDGVIYIGGFFTSISGISRTNLAAVSIDGHVLDWTPTTDKTVQHFAFDTSNNVLYAVGDFTQVNGALPRYLASFAVP